ncbi:hypothetical protein TRAPUB_10173 [Trametes pubescens]|uniref:Uncharacterized protein n=1 Tax=Trametes pubescens TaxID=154538 RepID=A0A1M2W0H7_TRAPU|nr:hypothetical protein TRAPUB_10173 [Trametes pubescens]
MLASAVHLPPLTSTSITTVPRGFYKDSDTFDGRTPVQVTYDYVIPRVRATYLYAQTLYQDVYALVEPHLPYFFELKEGMDESLGLLVYAIMVDPCGTLDWCWHNVISREGIPQMLAQTGREVALEVGRRVRYHARVAHRLLLLLRRGSENRAKHARGKQRELLQPGPTPHGFVRVKRYFGTEAPLRWPAGLGDCWVDLPLEPDDSLDLRPLRRIWNMENCYVMLAGPSKRIRIGRRPDEKLSALAWVVSLGPDSTLCVIERPTPETIAARRYRAHLKNGIDVSEVAYALARLGSLLLWIPITFVALVAFAFWQALHFCAIIIHHILGKLFAIFCVIGLCAHRGHDELCFSLWVARRNGATFPGLLLVVGRTLLLWLGQGVKLAWIVVISDVGLVENEQVARLGGRDQEHDKDTDASELSDTESLVEVEEIS